MHKAEVSRAEADVDRRAVAQPGREQRLEEEAEVHGRVDHALGADRQPPRLADHEVGPLHDNDGHKERSLRGRVGVQGTRAREGSGKKGGWLV